MRRVLATEPGGALYAKRQVMVEPVFADTKFNRRCDRFLRRGRAACRIRMATDQRHPQPAQAVAPHHRDCCLRAAGARRRARPLTGSSTSTGTNGTPAAPFPQQPPRIAIARRAGAGPPLVVQLSSEVRVGWKR